MYYISFVPTSWFVTTLSEVCITWREYHLKIWSDSKEVLCVLGKAGNLLEASKQQLKNQWVIYYISFVATSWLITTLSDVCITWEDYHYKMWSVGPGLVEGQPASDQHSKCTCTNLCAHGGQVHRCLLRANDQHNNMHQHGQVHDALTLCLCTRWNNVLCSWRFSLTTWQIHHYHSNL